MHPPYGPHKIATNGQVVLPKDVLAVAGLEPGDSVYVQALSTTLRARCWWFRRKPLLSGSRLGGESDES